jgi:hypothetical protein
MIPGQYKRLMPEAIFSTGQAAGAKYSNAISATANTAGREKSPGISRDCAHLDHGHDHGWFLLRLHRAPKRFQHQR